MAEYCLDYTKITSTKPFFTGDSFYDERNWNYRRTNSVRKKFFKTKSFLNTIKSKFVDKEL